jgi:fructose/tagatose bisphosphate aldolase
MGVLTDPAEAARFVEQTDVNALAVSIGNVHLKSEDTFDIDLNRLKNIRRAANAPLVIHGGTGLPENKIPELVGFESFYNPNLNQFEGYFPPRP